MFTTHCLPTHRSPPAPIKCEISQWLITSLLSPSRACSSLSPKTPLGQVHHSSQNCLCPDCWKAAVTSALLLLAKSEKASLPVWPWQLLFFCDQQYNCSSTFYWLSISFFFIIAIMFAWSHSPRHWLYRFKATHVFVLAKCACNLLNVKPFCLVIWMIGFLPSCSGK